MAVYTHLGAEDLAELIAEFNVGELRSAKGIAEGVSNSNWLIETSGKDGQGARFILTMYEFRIDITELPYFLGLLDHLAERGCPVPRTIHDRSGALYRHIGDKALALIEFLPGVSVSHPTAGQALAVGRALAQLHRAAADYPASRANGMDLAESRRLADACTPAGLAEIDPALPALVQRELTSLEANWPQDLPRSVIHADLFPDNVLMLGDTVTGLIDFYFACNDAFAYDLAICVNAWCFEPDASFNITKGRAMIENYRRRRPLNAAEIDAFPALARGAAMRFLLTRLVDWLNVPEGALVKPKDPLEYFRKLRFHAQATTIRDYGADA